MIRRLQNQLGEVGYKRNYYNVSQRKDDKHWENIFHKILNHFTEILYVIS